MLSICRLQTGPQSAPKAIALAVVIAVSFLDVPGIASAQNSNEQFSAGKQIKVITHVGPASGYSVWARLVAAHLGRHISGSPSIIVQNMPGGGGMKAANYLYAMASKD